MSSGEGLGVFPSCHPKCSPPQCVPHSVFFSFPRCFYRCPRVFEWYSSPPPAPLPVMKITNQVVF